MKNKPLQTVLPLLSITKLNTLAKTLTNKQIPYQICEVCYQPRGLLLCQICKNNYHMKCLQISTIPLNFICPTCKVKFPSLTSSEAKQTHLTIYDDTKTVPHIHNASTSVSSKKHDTKNILTSKDSNITSTSATTSFLGNKHIRDNKGNNNITNNDTYNSYINSNTSSQSGIQRNKKGNCNINNNNSTNTALSSITSNETLRKERENKIILSFDHSNSQYKRRKIKIGVNHNINMYEFTNRYENQINFDDEEYERNQLKQVWSCSMNPLSQSEINSYIRTARLFWNYRNMFIENDLCGDFFEECEKLMKGKKMSEKRKERINKLKKELKELLRRGVDLNCHYDEMALKMLHICKYKTKVALLFLYKQLNPFIEEIEEGFKNDVVFFQNEILSTINDGDFYIEE